MRSPRRTLWPATPRLIRKAFETGGKSIGKGLKNLVHDVRHNGGWPSQVDSSGFEVGVNMGATPGSVVYRSELIELIQYSPQTPDDARDSVAVLPAVDQQVLHHGSGAGEESYRVGRPTRPYVFCDQLPQSRQVDERARVPRLFVPGTAGCRASRS